MNAPEREDVRAHAIRRARERHGIRLNLKELAALEERLRLGEGQVLRTDPDGSRVVRIRFLFDYIAVVFDPAIDCIRTVLPRHCREMKARPSERGN